jgi:predicted dehydrogenase
MSVRLGAPGRHMIRIGICGFGYWGPNLYRVFATNPAFQVVAVADRRDNCQAKARLLDPRLRIYANARELITSDDIDAVVIATPVSTHYELAALALRRSQHVLVEKPLCTNVEQGQELVALAERQRLALLVDHVYVFHDVVQKLRELKLAGAIGTVSYYDSLRINLGLFQPDMNVLWDLAPHDLSIMDYLFDEEPIHVEATGFCHVNPHLPDIVYLTAHYRSRMIAHLNLSWMSPVKVRRIAIGGSKQMAVWDDLNLEERIKIYDSGIETQAEAERSTIVPSYRIGDIYSPRLPGGEALARVAAHFARIIRTGEPSPIGGQSGLRVVRLLDAAQRSLEANLKILEGLSGPASRALA